MTSVGTRTSEAATSPSDAAAMCASAGLVGPACVAAASRRLVVSYVTKKSAADGAEPAIADRRPAKTPVRSARPLNACPDCSRVLIVSSGKSTVSTAVPATAPA